MQIGFLNIHSNFSLLRGVSKIDRLILEAKKRGSTAIALTDTNNLYGAIKFYEACLENDIKPILGITIYFKDGQSQKCSRLVLLAKNNIGYGTLIKLITEINFSENKQNGINYADIQILEKHSDNLILILPPLNSPVTYLLEENDTSDCIKILNKLKSIYKHDLYLGEWIDGTNPITIEIATLIEKMSKKLNIKTVPLPLIYYIDEEEKIAKEVLFKIQSTMLSDIEEDNIKAFQGMPHIDELKKLYSKKSIENLDGLISPIDIHLNLNNWIFPTPPKDANLTSEEQLKENISEGLRYRNLKITEEIKERIGYEFKIIKEKGYIDYFLVVISIIEIAHKKKIFTSTRGSVGGSLIAYLIGITTINPLEYKIPFERFLNPLRPSPPDIDIDIADTRRDEVLSFISTTFGKSNVAQIGTFGTMMARAVVRDIARALGYSYLEGDRVARLIPLGKQGAPMYLDTAIQQVEELKELYETNSDVKKIIDLAKTIEGNPRHISTHAGGIVIAPTTLTNYTPLEKNAKDDSKILTQYDMKAIESAGLLKFDILGLTSLSVLMHAVSLIKEEHGVDINIDTLTFDDKKTYKIISDGLTSGIFQLGGEGITKVAKKLKPESLYDVAALISLFRPGPAKNIPEYIKRKHGETEIKFFHPSMKKYLESSFGMLVYQEDLLNTAIELAKYDWAEVDVFRKAVGKKIPELMAEQEKIFKQRAIKFSKISKSQADYIWELFDPFKSYGFNKAHGFAYAKIAYQTAYLKANYTIEYVTACLTAEVSNKLTIKKYISEARLLDITFLPPDINNSYKEFTIEKNISGKRCIRYGFGLIKSLSDTVSFEILKKREDGKFTGMLDFISRVSKSITIDKKSFEVLIKTGCFDKFENRNTLIKNLDLLLNHTKEFSDTETNSHSLFETFETDYKLDLTKYEDTGINQKLFWENEFLGIYLSGHPLNQLKKKPTVNVEDILDMRVGDIVRIITIIDSITKIRQKNGKKMCILHLEDAQNNILDAVCFSDTVEEFEEYIAENNIVKIEGEIIIDRFNDEKKVKINNFIDIE